jgi:HEAT repeat protein
MQIRNTLIRRGSPLLLLGAALLLAAFGPAPAARAEQSRAVQAVDDALKELLPPPDLADEYKKALDERAKTLKKLTDDNSPLNTLGDMAEALLLQTWGDDRLSFTGGADSSAVDRAAREALLKRLLNGVKADLKWGEDNHDPDLRAAVVTLVGEFGASARSGYLGARRGNRLLVEGLPQFTQVIANLADRDRSPEVRIASASALAKLQSDPLVDATQVRPPEADVTPPRPVTIPAQRPLLKDPNVEVRRAAARALGDVLRGTRAADRGGYASSPVVEPSRENLVSFGPQVARLAGSVLADTETDPEVRRLCADALLQVGTSLNTKLRSAELVATLHKQFRPVVDALWEQTAALSKASRDADPEVRRMALRVLEEMGDVRVHWVHPETLPVAPIPEIRPPLKPGPRTQAAPAGMGEVQLTYLAQPAPAKAPGEPPPLGDAIPALMRALQDPEVRIRLAAVDALEAITARTGNDTLAQEMGKGPAAAAARGLTRALTDPDRFVRWAAARTLGKTAPLNDAQDGPQVEAAAVAGLARLLSDRDPDVRLRTALALEHFGKAAQSAVPALAVAASRGDLEARISASHAIEMIGGHAAEAVPALALGLTDPSVRLRRTVASALDAYGADARQARPALNRALADDDPEVRRLVSNALIKIGTRR